jgi:hypothetical protein
VVLIFWIGFAELVNSVASGSAFAMTMLNTAFEITYCIFLEEVYCTKIQYFREAYAIGSPF